MDSAGGVVTRSYDDVNRVITEATPQGSVTYNYDAVGRRASITVAGQPQLGYTFDNANRLAQITQGSSSVGFGYDNANRRSSLTLPNGVTVIYGYDNNSRVTGITYKFGTNTLGNLTYSYDQLGRRTQVGGSFARTNLPGAVTSSAYDAANELNNWNGTLISYDANGNMLGDGHNAFTWNARNQVATLNSVALQYDAFGRRIKNAAGTSFLFDRANPAQELSGSTVTANVWTGAIDEVFQRSDSSGTVVPLTDALGSTVALVNSSGAIATTYSYDPFGNTTAAGGASANPSQYTGRENEGNGLYYYRARYYSSALQRFASEDPLGFDAGDVNLYAYVLDNPTNYKDPSGTTCYYSQSTGVLTCYPSSIPLQTPNSCKLAGRKDHEKPYYQAQGYSGTDTGRNNPFAQDESDVGPAPRGPWRATGDWHDKAHGPRRSRNVMDIYPLPGNDCASTGRNCDTFRIHGNNLENDASKGCIILPSNRTTIPPGEIVYVTE